MSATLLWDARRLRRGALPPLQEVLDACDRALLKRVIMEDFATDGKPIGKRRRAAMDLRLDASLDAMSSLRLSPRASHDWILVPQGSYVLNASTRIITWHLHTVLVPLCGSDILAGLLCGASGCPAPFQRARKPDKRGKPPLLFNDDRAGEDKGLRPYEGRPYALMPWEETLAYKVWLGGEWCCRERYVALASAFWEMTFFGFEYDRAQARMAQEKAKRLMGSRDAPKKSPTPTGAKKRSKGSAHLCGPPRSDRFGEEGLEQLARRVASLNQREQYALYERLYDLAQRLERGKQ